MFSNRAKYWGRGLQSCGIFKHRHIFGDIWVASKIFNFSPWPAILRCFQTLPHIWLLQCLKCPGCWKSCCVFKSCKIFGPWPAFLWYFQTLPCWWLQIEELKFFPVEHCLFGGFNRLNFHRCWQSCGTFKNRNHYLQSCGILEHCHLFGVLNNSTISSWLTILLYFQIWQNIGWLQ